VTATPLLDEVIAAHGGTKRWAEVRRLSLRIRIRGNILLLRLQSPRTRFLNVSVDTQRIHTSLDWFPRQGMTGHLDGQYLRIESSDGRQVVAERDVRRTAEGRVIRRLVWDDLDLLYFLGYSLWNYAVTPFLFLWPGFECREGAPLRERNGATLRSLHVTYPPGFPTHSREQTCYFDTVGLLRRIEYSADVFADRARAVHYCEAHKTFDGLTFPTHRLVFARTASGRSLRWFRLMEGWVDDVAAV
jgi:hypothetical protein